jgi:DNA-binding transcriptional LysR family regulator
MRISYLNEFILLARMLNFSEAARLLDITQPALSKHVNALEQDLGTKLIDRSTRPLTLTKAGSILYDEAVIICDSYDRA